MNFTQLEVQPEIVKAIEKIGIYEPTVIQEKVIPLILQGKDVIGMSRTGSGKTLAFGVPAVQNIRHGAGLQVLILTPTRELAVQITGELKKYAVNLNCFVTTVYGGVSYDAQVKSIKQADIVVATPGRLLDHLRQRTINLSKVKTFILDEADKMVEMGFIEDIEEMLKYTPSDKQVLLFGATISLEIEHLKNDYMHNPQVAQAEIHVEKDLLKQYYYEISPHEKFSLLVHLLKKEESDRIMIFCSARSTVEVLTRNLRDQGIRAEMIHGKLTQNRRLQVIEGFNKGKSKILVASAVAARGLHIEGVSHIYNYDLSKDPQEYIHRVGRTARAGNQGVAITLLTARDHDSFRHILDKYPIEIKELPKENFTKLRFNARANERRNDSQYGDRRGRQLPHSRGRFNAPNHSPGGSRGRYSNNRSRTSNASKSRSGWRARQR